MPRTLRRVLLALTPLLVAPAALASSDYPPTLKSELGLRSDPPCTLCHRNDLGGTNTVVTSFGLSLMRLYALRGKDKGGLVSAIHEEQADEFDNDCDGVPDMVEIEEGRDPSHSDLDGGACAEGAVPVVSGDVPLLQTGCAVGPRGGAGPGAALTGALALVVLGLGRRRLAGAATGVRGSRARSPRGSDRRRSRPR